MTTEQDNFYRAMDIMRRLRGPGGCPWDAEQSHDSLKRYLIEECYEVVEAIDKQDDALLCEELGDLLLQPLFHAAIAEERGSFTIDDVLQSLSDKLVRRHPHVFGDQEIKTSNEQVANWEKIKKEEKGEERKTALSGIPPHLPALMKAQKITEKAARVGFDWEHVDQVYGKVLEELQELEESMASRDESAMEAELGDLLFAIVNLGRFIAVNPEEALSKTISRFERRFNYIEETLHGRGENLKDATLDEMEMLWQEAKGKEANLLCGSQS